MSFIRAEGAERAGHRLLIKLPRTKTAHAQILPTPPQICENRARLNEMARIMFKKASTMITSALLAISLAPAFGHEAVVTEVNSHSHFAGKLGYRVTEDLMVTMDGKSVKVMIDGFYHTRSGKPALMFSAGQHIVLPRADKNGTVHAYRWEIRSK